MNIETTKRFKKNISTGNYERYIHKDKHIYKLCIPFTQWSRKSSCAVNQWIRRFHLGTHKFYRWGTIYQWNETSKTFIEFNIDANSPKELEPEPEPENENHNENERIHKDISLKKETDIDIENQENIQNTERKKDEDEDEFDADIFQNPDMIFKKMFEEKELEKHTKQNNHQSSCILQCFDGDKDGNPSSKNTDVTLYTNTTSQSYSVSTTKFCCRNCGIIYKTRSGLFKHQKHCVSPKTDLVVSSETSPMNSNSATAIQQTTNFNNTNHTTHNNQRILIQNNIQINDIGNENPKWLTSQILFQALSNIEKAIPKLMEKKHFNDDFPENKNLRLNTKRDVNKLLQVFEGGRWRIKDSKQTFYRVIVDVYSILSDALIDTQSEDEIAEDVREARRSQRFLQKVQQIRPLWKEFESKLQSQDKETMEELWNDLKILLMDRQLAIEQGCE
jgi:hypothetical protein